MPTTLVQPSGASFAHFADPAAQWAAMPTFVLGEFAIVFAALAALVHAVRAGRAERTAFLAALVAGTVNDLVFMALPLVDNFWHGQATVMLTPRLPLYIPCLYVLFLYYPTVAAARLGLARGPTLAVAGLLAVLTYAPFDIVGAKFLWWTWHDADPPIRARLLGVPVSSTLFVLTFTGGFATWLGPLLTRREPPTRREAFASLARAALLSTPLLMLQMAPLQVLDGGAPAYRALVAGLVVYATVAVVGLVRSRQPAAPLATQPSPTAFPLGLVPYGAALVVSIGLFDPGDHVSTGIHQTVGPCDAVVSDVTGGSRRAFLCPADFDEDFDFRCTTTPADGARWYTLCGRPFDARAPYAGAVVLYVALALAGYVALCRTGGQRASA